MVTAPRRSRRGPRRGSRHRWPLHGPVHPRQAGHRLAQQQFIAQKHVCPDGARAHTRCRAGWWWAPARHQRHHRPPIRYQQLATELCVADPQNSVFAALPRQRGTPASPARARASRGIGRPRVGAQLHPHPGGPHGGGERRRPVLVAMRVLSGLLWGARGPSTGTNFGGHAAACHAMRERGERAAPSFRCCAMRGKRYLPNYHATAGWLQQFATARRHSSAGPHWRTTRAPCYGSLLLAGLGPALSTAPPARTAAQSFPADHGAHPDPHRGGGTSPGRPRQAGASGFQVTFFPFTGRRHAGPGGRRPPPRDGWCLPTRSPTSRAKGSGRPAIRRGTSRARPPLTRGSSCATGRWGATGDARAGFPRAEFDLNLAFAPTQPVLLQGRDGLSRKGPGQNQASYCSLCSWPRRHPHAARPAFRSAGQAWLDHTME